VAGVFAAPPRGIILHGSRSGRSQPVDLEFDGTRRYAVNEPNGYGWSATVGEDAVSIHMAPDQWGWNARGASSHYLAVEFAQGTGSDPITDGQVRAFCWLVRAEWVPRWPALPIDHLPTHAELDGTPIYGGQYDGKTDVFSRGARAADKLRDRIQARLADLRWAV
jgi:hypothetical protein